MDKLIILDRDGVINYDSVDFIKSPDEWIPIPGSLEAIAQLNKAGYIVAVATNQSGIGRKLFTEEILAAIHEKMQNTLATFGGHIDKIFYCPHKPQDHCNCRKPKPGLLHQIADYYPYSLKNTFFIGDSPRDVEAANAVGATPILLQSTTINLQIDDLSANYIFPNLASAVENILSGKLKIKN